jgi:hypothetical protein
MSDFIHKHRISQSLVYRWRDELLAHAVNALQIQQSSKKEARPEQENARFKTLVGKLTRE